MEFLTAPAASSCAVERLAQGIPHNAHIVERKLLATGELLALFMSLAGDHHDIARLRIRNGREDRGAAVGVVLHPPVDPGQDLGDDRLRVL